MLLFIPSFSFSRQLVNGPIKTILFDALMIICSVKFGHLNGGRLQNLILCSAATVLLGMWSVGFRLYEL